MAFAAMLLTITAFALDVTAQTPELRVVETQPKAHIRDAAPDGSIEIRFDRALDRSTVSAGSFWAFGRWSGSVMGTFSFARGDSVVRITPDMPLSSGERVMVVLSHDLRGADGSAMRGAGYSFRYWTRSIPANLQFSEVSRLSARDSPLVQTRAYGGFAANLNDDRLLDLAIVNEDTADLRVFLNQGDAGTRFDAFLRPPEPLGDRASPSETSDFNRDGKMDVCIVNIGVQSLSVLLGRGDGTFEPQQTVSVGLTPRGVTVLDMDGDGDIDIVVANHGSSDLSLLFNDGRGNFVAGLSIDAGGDGEWAIEAEDMDNDGILDLIVGCQSSQTVHVNRGLGNGSFQEVDSSDAGGRVWMLNCGDLNDDGHEDVVTVNSRDNNAAVLMGNGKGQLGSPAMTATDLFPLASDLADLDGDGDLDWVTSSFNGDWALRTNNGDGSFSFNRRFAAPQAASCSIPFDIDNDGDVDLALIDELADVIIIYENTGTSTVVEQRKWGEVKGLFRR